jgi:hypothetical protein
MTHCATVSRIQNSAGSSTGALIGADVHEQ